VLGAVFKHYFSRGAPGDVYMVSVQPCFDKKLEASRLDFHEDARACADVDLVLSTSELWALLRKQAEAQAREQEQEQEREQEQAQGEREVRSADVTVLQLLQALEPDACSGKDSVEGMFRSFSADGCQLVMAAHAEAGSGGYMDYIARHAAETLLGRDLWGPAAGSRPALPLQAGRNIDIAEVQIAARSAADSVSAEDGGDGAVQGAEESSAVSVSTGASLRFAKVYGFRNIQSLMLKMRRGKCEYDLVEVMACPSGCVNGGGQLRSSNNETAAESKQRIAAVDQEFHRVRVRRPEDSPLAQFLYAEGRLGRPYSDEALSLLHTRYHAVPKLEEVAPLAAKW